MGTYGNNQMEIDTKAVCFADILEVELKNATQDFKDGIEWTRTGDTTFHFQGTGEKIAWIRNEKGNPLVQLCAWCAENLDRNFPASGRLANVWDSQIWFYSTDFASEEICFHEVVDRAVEMDIFPEQDGEEEKIAAIEMWKTKFADDFYEWCWDNEVFYDDDIATIYFDWNGQEWGESNYETQRQINIGNTINALAREFFDC
jgi:hypothetical protein